MHAWEFSAPMNLRLNLIHVYWYHYRYYGGCTCTLTQKCAAIENDIGESGLC